MNFSALVDEGTSRLKNLSEMSLVMQFQKGLAQELEISRDESMIITGTPFFSSPNNIYMLLCVSSVDGNSQLNMQHSVDNLLGLSTLTYDIVLEELIPPVWKRLSLVTGNIYEACYSRDEKYLVDISTGLPRYNKFDTKSVFDMYIDTQLIAYEYANKVGLVLLKADGDKPIVKAISRLELHSYITTLRTHLDLDNKTLSSEELVSLSRLDRLYENYSVFDYNLRNVLPDISVQD